MVEVFKWLLLGAVLGFCIQWALDTASMKRLALAIPKQDELDDLRQKTNTLEANLKQSGAVSQELTLAQATIADLQSQILSLKSQPVVIAESTKEVAGTAPSEASLADIDGLTPDQIASLNSAGITTPSDLASKSDEEILAALDAQPWDMIDPSPWIKQAKSLTAGTSQTATETNSNSHSDDFTKIDGLTPEQIEKLTAAGITTFQALTSTPPDQLLEIIEAQPWDMVDPDVWIAQSKELA